MLLTNREQEWIIAHPISLTELFDKPLGDAGDRNCIPVQLDWTQALINNTIEQHILVIQRLL